MAKTQTPTGHFEVGGRLDRPTIAKHRERLGSKFSTLGLMRGPNQWVHWDRVNAFAKGMGDPNPLFNDEAYAKSSCYGDVVAPPPFIMSVWRGMVIQGMPGVHIMMGGNDYEFLLPMMEGNKITAECVFARLNEKKSKFSDLFLIEEYDTTFQNQKGNVLVKQTSYAIRHERAEIAQGLENTTKAAKAEFPHPWTEEEVCAIEAEQIDKKIQGATPRFWEDVNVGDSLPDFVRGPARIIDIIGQMATHDVTFSGPVGLHFVTRHHKGYSYFHPISRGHEHIEVIHWDVHLANYCGYPYPYDWGHSRQMWSMNAMTDWCGDHGWLKRASAKYHRMVYLSDVIRIKSRITKKYVDENGEHCVDIAFNSMNQRDEDVMPGETTVILPSREQNTWPVKIRLEKLGRSAGR